MLKRRAEVPLTVPARSGAEDGWKALALIVDLIKHAETKAGLALAAAGATGGVVYTLIRTTPEISVVLGLSAGVSTVLVLTAATFAGLALVPRRRSGPDSINLLYYLHVAADYGGRADTYADEFAALVRNPDALVAAIAQQVWSNALVAKRKYRWAGLALNALLGALAVLAIAAAVSVLQSP
ncbi:Pycsar system effector family protein [Nonomuraea fuscirosea]|uniref:Pycsar system effector family protein n=1 Tax=Nonomuraea fuscirosea TaxID=1291556 RepID=UPI0033FE0419